MHNVILDQGSGVKMRVRWLRAQMHPTRPDVVPSFDDPGSFSLDIEAGAVGMNLADLTGALNRGLLKNSALQNVSLKPAGRQLKLSGTLHKGVSLPFEMLCDIGAASDGRVRVHVAKLSVLKLPVKGLMKAFQLKTADLVDPKGVRGVQVDGDDIYFDPEQLLPAPKKRGKLTDVHISTKTGDIVEIYGSARPEVIQAREWRNFIRLQGGTLEFGKITMHDTDIVLIDISNDQWFNFDLNRYQTQMVNGYTRMTPQAGLQIFMPDIDKLPRGKNQNISLQWMKHRNLPPPADITR